MSAPAPLATLTCEDFEPRINDAFVLRHGGAGGELALILAEIRRLGRAKRTGGAFSLLFLAPAGPFLPQAIYPLTHAALGTIELFLVPLGRLPGGNGYEAVFT
jgi:hypothetical protein